MAGGVDRCGFRGQGRTCGRNRGHAGVHRSSGVALFEDPQDGTEDDTRRIRESDADPMAGVTPEGAGGFGGDWNDPMRGTLAAQLYPVFSYDGPSAVKHQTDDALHTVAAWLIQRARWYETRHRGWRYKLLAIYFRVVAQEIEAEREAMTRNG